MPRKYLIFEELPEGVDETWVHGAVLGGMTGYDNESLSRSYFVAGHTLVSSVLENVADAHELVCPILYLYRHGIELYLKVLTKPKRLSHNISDLLKEFCRIVDSTYGQRVPNWFTGPIVQLAEFDLQSDTFRYGTNLKGEVSFKSDEELWVDLRALRKAMALVELGFRRVLTAEHIGIEELNRVAPRRPEYE